MQPERYKPPRYTDILEDEVRKSIGDSGIIHVIESVPPVPHVAASSVPVPATRLEEPKSVPMHRVNFGVQTEAVSPIRMQVKLDFATAESLSIIIVPTIPSAIQTELEALRTELAHAKEELSRKCASASSKDRYSLELQARLDAAIAENAGHRKSIESLTEERALLARQTELYEDQRKSMHQCIQQLKGNLRVFCRVKPAPHGEPMVVDFPELRVAKVLAEQGKSGGPKPTIVEIEVKDARLAHSFDRVFTPDTTQQEVFGEVAPFLQSAFDGDHVCIFAYGQTGSGKTYTMEGPPDDELYVGERLTPASGILPRAGDFIFAERARLAEKGYKCALAFSAVEIYNEELRDLLNSGTEELQLVTGKDGMAEVHGLGAAKIASLEELMGAIKAASRNRKTGKTELNERSSRSHSIYQIRIEVEKPGNAKRFSGLLNIVDLAGSERASKDAIVSKSEELMREAKHINQSLTTLGRVLTMLADRRATKKAAIPYRESKLTRVLQSSLQFESKTLVFVTICPLSQNVGQSKESLRFASTASLAC